MPLELEVTTNYADNTHGLDGLIRLQSENCQHICVAKSEYNFTDALRRTTSMLQGEKKTLDVSGQVLTHQPLLQLWFSTKGTDFQTGVAWAPPQIFLTLTFCVVSKL